MATSLLLADDSPTIAKILSLALSKEDYAVRSVATADKALEELQKEPPEVFMVDVALPAKNGKEFIKYIKSAPKLSKIKIILVTNAFEPVDEAELLKEGAHGVLVKPFDPATLRQKLKDVLSGTTSTSDTVSLQSESAVMPPPLPGVEVEKEPTSLNIDLPPPDAPPEIPIVPPPTPKVKGPNEDTTSGLTFEFGTNTMNMNASQLSAQLETVLPPPQNEPTVMLDINDGALNLNFDDAQVAPTTEFAATSGAPLPQETVLPETPPPAPTEEVPQAASNQEALNQFFNAEVETPEPVPSVPAENTPTTYEINTMGSGVSGPEAPAGASAAAMPGVFDVGGSTFAFSPDYVNRLTKAFEGTENEPAVAKNFKQKPQLEEPVFHMESSDASPAPESEPIPAHAAAPSASWSAMDVDKMEKIIREEIRAAIQDIVPRLAERLIKEELERVMKEQES